MPRKFNEQEKQWIRQKLMEEGKRSFEARGLRKTSVEDLTKATGISQGAFYLFFASKEELFYELLLAEEALIREQLLEWAEAGDVTKASIRRFISESFRLMSENALIRTMYFQGELERLVRKLPPEKLEQNFAEDQDALQHVVRKWQAAGILRKERPELIVSMFRSLVLLSLHKQEIGEMIYDETTELLVRLIVDGMYASREEEGLSHD
ncbi:TetR/AcrR family transcriptional regulator [Paenibacillus campinasensis]|uniref:TetR family transcriptional regulator n=1 Tax=Paenibacillus campinasensis TaxID=66347 RepID=A0A268EZS7_9BACL|nr:TetR/AcrR family transcriptional regulator [Paenibacillus campinasensis]MUG66364.1 TetR family transcriptional regulator [Paenibacillus campinasensis]PAD78636.1 TetR family transcriptional regulator [Paenibacillus campinasensis]